MSSRRKRIEKLLKRPSSMRFEEFRQALKDIGALPKRTEGSHTWFVKPGVGMMPVPTKGGHKVAHRYLDEACKVFKIDELDLDTLDIDLGPEFES